MPAQTAEYVDTATCYDAKLDGQPVGRADNGHAAAAALGREDRPEFRGCRVRERFAGFRTSAAPVARTQAALGRVAVHAEGNGKGKFREKLKIEIFSFDFDFNL